MRAAGGCCSRGRQQRNLLAQGQFSVISAFSIENSKESWLFMLQFAVPRAAAQHRRRRAQAPAAGRLHSAWRTGCRSPAALRLPRIRACQLQHRIASPMGASRRCGRSSRGGDGDEDRVVAVRLEADVLLLGRSGQRQQRCQHNGGKFLPKW